MTSRVQYPDKTHWATHRTTPALLCRQRLRSLPREGEVKPAALLVDMAIVELFSDYNNKQLIYKKVLLICLIYLKNGHVT